MRSARAAPAAIARRASQLSHAIGAGSTPSAHDSAPEASLPCRRMLRLGRADGIFFQRRGRGRGRDGEVAVLAARHSGEHVQVPDAGRLAEPVGVALFSPVAAGTPIDRATSAQLARSSAVTGPPYPARPTS